MSGREDLFVRPIRYTAQQRGERLVVDEQSQSRPTLLVCQLRIAEADLRRLPVCACQQLFAEFVDATGDQ